MKLWQSGTAPIVSFTIMTSYKIFSSIIILERGPFKIVNKAIGLGMTRRPIQNVSFNFFSIRICAPSISTRSTSSVLPTEVFQDVEGEHLVICCSRPTLTNSVADNLAHRKHHHPALLLLCPLLIFLF